MFNYQNLQLLDFDGGITDNVIDSPINRYQYADNLLITENKKPYTRDGSIIWDSVNYQIPAGSQRINAFIDHYKQLLFTISAKKLYFILSGAWSTLQGPSGNDVFAYGDVNSTILWSNWNNQTFVANDSYSPVTRIFKDGSNVLRARTAGMPALSSSPSLAGTASTKNYLYKFYYFYTFNVGTVIFNEEGATTTVQILNVAEPSPGTPINITGIPVLSNGLIYNYDTANIKVRIYRTQDGGTTFNYVGEVTNGTTTYSDQSSDSTILANSSIYTDSGELDHEVPPQCKAFHVTDSMALYGNIKTSTGEQQTNKLLQSIPYAPYATNGLMYLELDDEIVAISSVGQTPVVLCKNRVYRLDGQYTESGGGLLQAQEIESTVGCISAASVVQVQRGVCFAGDSGFYFTDGYEVRNLSVATTDRYKLLTQTDQQKKRIYGTFDRADKRVWWSVQEDGETEVSACYVLDTRYGLGKYGSGLQGDDLENISTLFTTISGGYINEDFTDNFRPTAIIFYGGNLIRGDSRGYIFSHQRGLTSDPKINTLLTPSQWDINTIFWRLRTVATSFGTSLKRKFIPKMVITAENETNISLQVVSINDVGRSEYFLTPLRFRKNCIWGDPVPFWGDNFAVWNYQGIIQEERKFNSDGLRCAYKQIELTNAYVQIVTSDHIGVVSNNVALKTVTLDNIVDYEWPDYLSDHYIYFEIDNYSKGYLIKSNTATTLTMDTSSNMPIVQNGNFIIRGYPKNEVFNLVSISMWYAYLGEANNYNTSSAGATPS